MQKIDTAQLLADQLYMSGYRPRRLLSSGNAKLRKSARTIGLSLAPAKTSGHQVCASSSTECRQHLAAAAKEFPVGRRVRYYPLAGRSEHIETSIRSQPWALGSGDIIVSIAGRNGGVLVSHLEVI